MIKKHKLLWSAGSLLIFVALFIGVTHDATWIHQFDQAIISRVISFRPAALTSFLIGVTTLGEPLSVAIIGITFVVALIVRRFYPEALFVAMNVLLFSGMNAVIKQIVRRPRPFVADPSITPLVRIGGFSFPSGHSSGTMLLYGTIIILASLYFKKASWRRSVIGLSILMILLTGYSRIYLQVHYPTDVLAGYMMAFTGLMWSWWCLDHYMSRQEKKRLLS